METAIARIGRKLVKEIVGRSNEHLLEDYLGRQEAAAIYTVKD
jgi:hypothetical protein